MSVSDSLIQGAAAYIVDRRGRGDKTMWESGGKSSETGLIRGRPSAYRYRDPVKPNRDRLTIRNAIRCRVMRTV